MSDKKTKKRGKLFVIILAMIVLIIALSSFFELREDESALLQRFGKVEAVYVKQLTPMLAEQISSYGYDVPIYEGTGLKFKIPFIDNVISYSNLLLTYDTPPRQVITSDKKKLYFDNNAQWRIDNPLQFYIAVGNYSVARDRIDNIIYSNMNEKVGKMESHILITDKVAVESMLAELANTVTKESKKFGVTVFDIRIKRTDLPQENYESIFNRMITERNRIAAMYRSEGDEEAIKIRSNTDREVLFITSDAEKTALTIKGEGDGEAARIFTEAYGKDPEFFEFYNYLDAYRATLGDKTTLFVPIDSPFAKYLLGNMPTLAKHVPVAPIIPIIE